MKNNLISLFLVFLFLGSTAIVSYAAPVPGVYTTGLSNGTATVQSLFGGEFGLGDISSGVAKDDSWSASGYEKTFESVGDWVVIDSTHIYREIYTERSGGSGTVQGWFHGEPLGTTYDFTGKSSNTFTQYWSRSSDTDPNWVWDYASGVGTSVSTYLSAPFITTRVYEYTYDSSNYRIEGDYQYITFDTIDLSYTIAAAPVPEPTTMMLFGIGLLGLAGISRRKK